MRVIYFIDNNQIINLFESLINEWNLINNKMSNNDMCDLTRCLKPKV